MKTIKIFGGDSLWEKFICGLAVSIFAAVLFVYFCAQNTGEITLRVTRNLSLVLFAIAAVTYMLSLIIFRRALTALVFCVVCWLGFYLAPLMRDFIVEYWPFKRGRIIFLTIAILFVAYVAAVVFRKFHLTLHAIYLFMGVLGVIFAINLGILIYASTQEKTAQKDLVPVKRDFYVDEKTKSPNIYWIHPDGMLGINAVKKYFGEDQSEFLDALRARGFMLNPDANFEARHRTANAVPILMNPYSYDEWISKVITPIEKPINSYNFTYLRMNSELQYALLSKNYALNIVAFYGYYYPVKGGRLWLMGLPRRNIFSFDDVRDYWFMEAFLFRNPYVQHIIHFISSYFSKTQSYQKHIDSEKLQEIFMKGWDPSQSSLDFVAALYDILHGDYLEPRLTIIHDLRPHNPYIHASDGEVIKKGRNMNPLDYYPQHVWSAKVLVDVLDMILEIDPDAVIVIQADHGLHGNTEEDFKKAFGEDADKIELWNCVMSAIRVPEKFQTGEEHYAMETPLNLTRYLINNFVGKNYEYVH